LLPPVAKQAKAFHLSSSQLLTLLDLPQNWERDSLFDYVHWVEKRRAALGLGRREIAKLFHLNETECSRCPFSDNI